MFDAKGIETVRRDTCPVVMKILEKALRVVFDTRDLSEVWTARGGDNHVVLCCVDCFGCGGGCFKLTEPSLQFSSSWYFKPRTCLCCS